MNPPYNRGKGSGSMKSGKDNYTSAFAAFGEQDPTATTNRLSTVFSKIDGCSNLGASIATCFFDLAHAKLKPGGRLGLVLPMTATSNEGWKRISQNNSQVLHRRENYIIWNEQIWQIGFFRRYKHGGDHTGSQKTAQRRTTFRTRRFCNV